MKTFFTLAFISASCTFCYAQPGTLDLSFGTNGKVATDFGSASTSDNLEELLIQPDGKLIAIGWYHTGSTVNYSDLAMSRYKTNGELDSTFGTNGLVSMNLSSHGWMTEFVRCAVLQNDGKILCAGGIDGPSNIESFVTRFLPNGAIDSSFAINGTYSYNSVVNNPDEAYGLALQDNGKIILGIRESGDVIRLNTNGTIDSSFGTNGIANVGQAIERIAVQPDGKILAAGEYNPQNPWWWYFGIVRLNSTGTIDNGFGINGRCFFDHTNILGPNYWSIWINAIAIQPNGKIVLGGGVTTQNSFPDSTTFAMGRITENGVLDSAFGVDGRQVVEFPGDFERISDISIQANGKIVFVGQADNSDIAIAVLNTNGNIDSSFNGTGKLQVDFSGSFDYGAASVIQPDGKLVVAGPVYNTDYDFGLVRIFSSQVSAANDDLRPLNNALLYPNPVVSEATIAYKLENAGMVSLDLYDMNGRFVQPIMPLKPGKAGWNKEVIQLDNDLPKGPYFVRITSSSNYSQAIKLFKTCNE